MARKEVRIDHDRLRNPETVEKVLQGELKKHGLDVHRHETDFEDVFTDDTRSKGHRVFKTKNVKYYGPWSHRG